MNDRFKFRVWNNMQKCYSQDDHYIDEDGQLNTNGKYIVEQCTGLKDKNGKLIFEGDIVKSGNHIYPVEWCLNGFAVDDGFEYLVDNEEWEVIGNIHENADLLENEE